jgi:hypothetical protein
MAKYGQRVILSKTHLLQCWAATIPFSTKTKLYVFLASPDLSHCILYKSDRFLDRVVGNSQSTSVKDVVNSVWA